ncbi:ABC-type multidrug transport system ATPase subunit/ABC-type multidrug transport system permease subunit [Hamadaea flava]|uniref:ATP-binding cassette domain-containing protein n=1 Tax=Hamadaea flava TaxID=1742688 RepID=A0ABV8LNB5_9ACTN|nr:ATP-binding cassette domain-containing protein [Hamadaea flava]MCP2329706.1 ABC-type multidrug transport system ATPase subunit/ABC-type multidrug transport system permease subunit [Hamadaea flava]
MTSSGQDGTDALTPVAVLDDKGRIRIGRDPGNDIVLPDLWVSGSHAEIRRVGAGHQLVDLGSTNGVHHNGRRVQKGDLKPGDRFTVGRHEFLYDGSRLYQHDDQGPTSFVADDITVDVGKATLLDDVSFALQQGTLLGIIGPSGCGKSTLVKAMTGFQKPSRGGLLYDGRDLYEHYSELRHRIGMVPQDDVLHRQLSVQRALRFSASLRFADDVPRKQRKERVGEVLELLGLSERAKQRIDTLSGGQRKRTSVALELLTEPSLLALDEPTSGLDPALDKEVMRELRLLADRGRTVVVVTHSVLHLDICDRVMVMCMGGHMGFFGPPDEVLPFFGAEDYADVFHKVTNEPRRWAQEFRNSEIYRRYIGEVAEELARVGDARKELVTVAAAAVEEPVEAEPAEVEPVAVVADPPVPRQAGAPEAETTRFADASKPAQASPTGVQDLSMKDRARHPRAPLRAFVTLCWRMLAVIASDRGYAAFLLGLPLALAVLSRAVPGDKGLSADPEGFALEGQRLIVVFVIGAAFMGVAVAIREIVNEQSIYRRERAIGLSPTAYLLSKVIVFLVIDAIQCAIFVYLAMFGRPKPPAALVFGDPMIEITLAATLVAVASTSIGLLASALVRTTEQTTPILVVSVMFQLVLSGGLFEITGQRALEIISTIDPSRWGFAAGAATTNLVGFPFPEAIWAPTAFNWWRAVLVLLLHIAVLLVAARFALRRFEPGRN